jgi:hypothetical protein
MCLYLGYCVSLSIFLFQLRERKNSLEEKKMKREDVERLEPVEKKGDRQEW